jgi:penicillin-binding protein 1A
MRFLLKIILKLISIGFIFGVTMLIGLVMYASTLLPNLPTIDQIREIPLNIPLRIYSSDQKLIAEYGNERRIPLTLDETPPLLIDAILATEDDRFYHHTGVDFPGLVRAALSNLANQAKSQGASTITMQVARNFFLNPEKTYTRKLTEILLAFNMERALTKDEILELYLNKIFLGHRSYGFAAAAQVYYGDELRNLSVPEIAMLAGLPKAPSRDNPISSPERAKQRRGYVLKRLHELGKIDDFSLQNATQAPVTASRHTADIDFQAPYVSEMARQTLYDHFGEQVYERGFNVFLTINSEYQQKANQALRAGLIAYDLRHGFKGPVDRFDPALLDEALNTGDTTAVMDKLDEFPASAEIIPAIITEVNEQSFMALTQNGLRVEVNWEQMKWARKYIAPNNQGPALSSASEVVAIGDIVYLKNNDDDIWSLSQIPEVSGALVCLDSHSGAILALSGGFDYYLSKFNRATQAKRQPGSNIKPFIYSAALENGFTPASLVSAAPIVIESDLEGIWRPQNYSKKFFGPTRLRKALSLSLNLVSVRLLRAMGLDTTIEHLEKFGFDPEELPHNLSLALGSTTVTPLDLASSFAVLANGGKKITPFLISKITDPEGNEIQLPDPDCEDCLSEIMIEDQIVTEQASTEQNDTENQPAENSPSKPASQNTSKQTITPQNAFLTQSILKQVIRSGTGRRALALNRSDLAGKTGTTNDFRDAWFSGFNPDINTTVFVGFDEPSHLGKRESGASAALPIWVDFMGRALQDYPERPEFVPENITTRFINKDSAEVTAPDDPDGYTEYYLVGTEPNNLVTPSSVNSSTGEASSVEDSSVNESLF